MLPEKIAAGAPAARSNRARRRTYFVAPLVNGVGSIMGKKPLRNGWRGRRLRRRAARVRRANPIGRPCRNSPSSVRSGSAGDRRALNAPIAP
jgi:hypothetical protein